MKKLKTNLTSFAKRLPLAQWLEHPTGVRKVVVWFRFPSRPQILYLSHVRGILNITT